MARRHRCLEEAPAFITRHTPNVFTRLLPDAALLHLEACEMDDTTTQITLAVQSTQTSAPCPLCATPTQRIHSHYERTLADLPWAQYRVCLQLRVRKWFCRNRSCSRRIFTERLPTIAAPWARRTLRLAQRFVALGVALGGKAGVRLGHQWDLVVSRNTLEFIPINPSMWPKPNTQTMNRKLPGTDYQTTSCDVVMYSGIVH